MIATCEQQAWRSGGGGAREAFLLEALDVGYLERELHLQDAQFLVLWMD